MLRLTYGLVVLLQEVKGVYYNIGGDFMGGHHWEQIVMLLLDRIESMKAREDEMNHRIDELMAENVRLTQLLRDKEYEGGIK